MITKNKTDFSLAVTMYILKIVLAIAISLLVLLIFLLICMALLAKNDSGGDTHFGCDFFTWYWLLWDPNPHGADCGCCFDSCFSFKDVRSTHSC